MGMVRAFWNEVIRAADSNWKPVALRATNNALHTQLISGGTAVGSTSAGLPVVDANLVPVEFFQDTDVLKSAGAALLGHASSASIKGSALTAGGTVALIQAIGQNFRWTDATANPTATFGMQLAAGDQFFYTGDLSTIKVFPEDDSTGTGAAEMNVSIFKQA